tara:strand:+ start:712 stop:1353 length:642 start_codon:yes stop_codon:yes gene_type:complete
MFKQNISIIGIPILYNIFQEIKDNLTFEISNFKNIDSFVKFSSEKKYNNKNNIIVTTISNKNFFFKKKVELKNIIFLSQEEKDNQDGDNNIFQHPIDIYTLIEKINIQLIKQKYNFQSKIKVKNYLMDLNSRIISNNKKSLKLTEREMDIILFLIEKKQPQKINDLQNQVWRYSSELETHTVETHIYRLRKKINDCFNDENFIISTDKGYFIE